MNLFAIIVLFIIMMRLFRVFIVRHFLIKQEGSFRLKYAIDKSRKFEYYDRLPNILYLFFLPLGEIYPSEAEYKEIYQYHKNG